MKVYTLTLLFGFLFFSSGCQTKIKGSNEPSNEIGLADKWSNQDLENLETAYFASGCFWCVEIIFENVRGVQEVISGYSGGKEVNPTYEDVGYGRTTHAEAVEIYYNPEVISYPELVLIFFGSHDPTTLNRQGPDRGPQYRSIAFYKNEEEKKIIESTIASLEESKVYDRPIVTEVKAFDIFYMAEDYHQDYERKNPNNSYIRQVSTPRYNRFKKNFSEYLKKDHH